MHFSSSVSDACFYARLYVQAGSILGILVAVAAYMLWWPSPFSAVNLETMASPLAYGNSPITPIMIEQEEQQDSLLPPRSAEEAV